MTITIAAIWAPILFSIVSVLLGYFYVDIFHSRRNKRLGDIYGGVMFMVTLPIGIIFALISWIIYFAVT